MRTSSERAAEALVPGLGGSYADKGVLSVTRVQEQVGEELQLGQRVRRINAQVRVRPRRFGAGCAHDLDTVANAQAVRHAGVALGYLHDVAAALSLRVREYSDIHDKAIAEAIGLPIADNRYVPTFAIGLGGEDAHSQEIFAALGPQVLNAVIDAAAPPPSRPQLPSNQQKNRFVTTQQREAGPILSTFGSVLLARRSVRSYALRPIAPAILRRFTALTIDGSEITVDLTGTAPQVDLPINMPLVGTVDIAIWVTLRSILLDAATHDPVPTNSGLFRAIRIVAPEGCLAKPVLGRGGRLRRDAWCRRACHPRRQ